jgi:iron complex outermembrane receptor protein
MLAQAAETSGFRCRLISQIIGLTCACLAFTSVAPAQTLPVGEDDSDNILVMEEVIVTAQRRELPILDVPASVTAFDMVDIESRKMANIADVARYTPNMEWDQTFLGSANVSAIFIRGIGTEAGFFERTADPSIAIYLDGAYIGRAVGSIFGIADVEQIEVLRGPQGTLFGRNATGGAVMVRTAVPVQDFMGWVDVTTGSDSRLDGRFAVNVPLSESVMTRFSGSSLNQDGYGESLQDGTEFGDTDLDSIRASLRWLPSDQTTIDISLDRSRSRQNPPAGTLLFASPHPMSPAGTWNFFVAPTNSVEGFGEGVTFDERFLTSSEFTNYSTGQSRSNLDTRGITANMEWRHDNLNLKSITSYREMESDWAYDVDMSPLLIIHDALKTDQDQFSQEFTLGGVTDSLDWLVGLYYFEEESRGFDEVILVPELSEVEFHPFLGIPNPLFGVQIGNSGEDGDARANSIAAFGHVDYSVNDRLHIFGGIRFTEEEKEVERRPNDPSPFGGAEQSFSDSSPALGIQYYFADNLQVYASVAEGFKSGGFNNIVSPGAPLRPFDQEESTAYEIGLKRSTDRLRLATAVFFTKYEDIQIPVFNFVLPEFRNAAEAEMKGAELELTAALSEKFTIQAGIGYLDAKFTRLDEDSLVGLTTPITLDSEIPNTPEWSFSTSLEYVTSLNTTTSLRLRADYSWRDEVEKVASNVAELRQEAYGLLYAAASLELNDGRWVLTLFGDNLTDEKYLLQGASNKAAFGIVVGSYGRPRTWGFTARFNFGGN